MKLSDFFECANCDGVGWYEGGKTIKTTCEKCDGRGALFVEKSGAKRKLTQTESNWLVRQLAQETPRRRNAKVR